MPKKRKTLANIKTTVWSGVAVHIIPPDIVHNKARRIFCFCLIDLSLQGDA
ncbi:conserved hypothetical protein [delta proteobacterium NaphS2]|nr:conserved hypothetical protein [delta proteobacterium NaphS2]